MNTEATQQVVPNAPPRILSAEERNDLRKFVLMGGTLSVEEARLVIESTRQGAGAAAMLPKEKKAAGGKGKKAALSDDALNSSLDSILGL